MFIFYNVSTKLTQRSWNFKLDEKMSILCQPYLPSLSLKAKTRRYVLSCQALIKNFICCTTLYILQEKLIKSSYVYSPDARWCRQKQQSTMKHNLLAILHEVLNFKVLVLVHLWTNCLKISHRWFLGSCTTSKFWTAIHDKILYFKGTWNTLVFIITYFFSNLTNIRRWWIFFVLFWEKDLPMVSTCLQQLAYVMQVRFSAVMVWWCVFCTVPACLHWFNEKVTFRR